ncbi:MAG: SDR family oxidoreductase [Verrucomicrobiota bacterium JB022]|nr:SDR family oxidoreductase [Verrucomicrobiota bacterium JB022]
MTKTSPDSPIVVVTGGNRGIGLEICRQLVQRGAQVILTARRPEAGEKALRELKSDRASFHVLDVTDSQSIADLRDHLQGQYGRLDVLINNAGIMDDEDNSGLDVGTDVVRETFATNTLAPLELSQALMPLLRKASPGRIVNLSSGLGAISSMGAGHPAYRISKAALNAVTRILAAELDGAVVVNSMCPGWVRTDMGGENAERDVSQGADTAVWLALEAPTDLTGRFLRDRQIIAW